MTADSTITLLKESAVLRHEPSTNSSMDGTLEHGVVLPVINESGGWVLVRISNTVQGWLPLWYLESPELTNDQEIAAYFSKETPIYAQESVDAEQIGLAESDSYIPINYESRGWTQIQYDGQYGYVETSAIQIVPLSQIPQEEEIASEEMNGADIPLDHIAIMRQSNQAFLSQPNVFSDILYTASYGQRFAVEKIVYDDAGNEYYRVLDDKGTEGYIETRTAQMANDSISHVGKPQAKSLSEATIMLDAGHGGEDPGAISEDQQTYEKEITLATANTIQKALKAAGATVIQTRTDDRFIELEERAAHSNAAEVDAFISIHYDASPVPDWHGITTYYFHEADESLARFVNQELSTLPLPNNGTHFGNYYVLRENNYPSILLELGYMSNQQDLPYIRSQDYYNQVADRIVNALTAFFQSEADTE
ncbi:hypothetical protein CL176_07930 [Suicoccus acidiformans]|uniref:N-acetylmuramoyl-L-alanine amidase n=2 Tax=Suicoccus acidiformans TaxID=2036206 RepID=A0A347WLH4_9LACT|nr:hypothetical protein CL176_07930 [Suicoccus acidiformans]